MEIKIGKKYGSWLVLKKSDKRKYYYVCKCMSCNNESEIYQYSLAKSANQKNCNKCTEIPVGSIYGDWTVLEIFYKKKKIKCRCLCKCGIVRVINKHNLMNGTSKRCRSCSADKLKSKVKTGQKFGKWTIIKEVIPSPERYRHFLCVCECGEERSVRLSGLISGENRSCGSCIINSLIGKEISHWTIIKKIPKEECGKNGYVLAKCWCGAIEEVSFTNITGLKSTSCGNCSKTMAIGERWGKFTIESFSHVSSHNAFIFNAKCDCGEKRAVVLSDVVSGRYKSCGCYGKEIIGLLNKFRIGESSHSWKSSITDEERLRKRNYPEYHEWTRGVLKKDNSTCILCGSTKNPTCHHLNAYSSFKSERTKISNGNVLCKEHHDLFHSIYGYEGNNTKEDFDEFIDNFSHMFKNNLTAAE